MKRMVYIFADFLLLATTACQDAGPRLQPDSDLADTLIDRGNAYSRKGQYDRAISDFDEAIRLRPDFADAYKQRGTAYETKGDHDRAIEDYNQAIRLNPKQRSPDWF
jgi:tetratricopeptide (TPR) repeat protein